ncbi:aldolase/citrate lyase family protein [Thermoflexus hugenholtzii]
MNKIAQPRRDFDLFLFSTDPDRIRLAVAGGAAGVVVDWEHIGKAERQAGFDTQINHDTPEDLQRVRACTTARVLCRINAFGPWTQKEIEAAVQAGADEILLPMVRSVEEVEQALEWIGGRCGLGILIETREAVAICERLARLPLTRAYLGLHDLAIERRTPNPFRAISDGIVERVRSAFPIPFGFAGLTLPDRGFPIPCRLLIAEMARLGCSFSFLRRSFLRDIVGRDPRVEIPRILEALREAFREPLSALEAQHQELLRAIEEADAFFSNRNRMVSLWPISRARPS